MVIMITTSHHSLLRDGIQRQHFLICEMCITLNGISCILHLPITHILLTHDPIHIFDALELMVTYLRDISLKA